MIKLKNEKWFAQGANRVCYLHPDDPRKILKIIKPWKRAEIKRHQAPWYKKLRPALCFDDNKQEYKALRRLEKRQKTNRYFPRCYGFVETDLGVALCVENVRSNGRRGKTVSLENYLRRYGFTDGVNQALNNLFEFLYDNLIITRDFRGFNIIVRYADAGINLVIVDGLGNPELIPVSSFIPIFGRAKIKRKINRFKSRLEHLAGKSCPNTLGAGCK